MYAVMDRVDYSTLQVGRAVQGPASQATPPRLEELACRAIVRSEMLKETMLSLPPHMVETLLSTAVKESNYESIAVIIAMWPTETLCLRRMITPQQYKTFLSEREFFKAVCSGILNRRECCQITCLDLRGWALDKRSLELLLSLLFLSLPWKAVSDVDSMIKTMTDHCLAAAEQATFKWRGWWDQLSDEEKFLPGNLDQFCHFSGQDQTDREFKEHWTEHLRTILTFVKKIWEQKRLRNLQEYCQTRSIMELTSSPLFQTSLQHLRAALTADCQGRFKDAAMAYMEGAPLLLQMAKEEGHCMPTKLLLKSKSQLYLNRIQLIKSKLEAGEDVPCNTSADPAHPNKDCVEEEFAKTLSYQPFNCGLDDVKGMEQAKEFLSKNVILPLTFPGLLDDVMRVKKGILLYGLPGTGKTMLMCAVAAAVSCPVFRVTAIDFISRWRGGEKSVELVREVFRCARQNQPCLVCVDDLEMVCGGKDNGDGLMVRLREELYSQLKEATAENQVTVIAASQKPWLIPGTLRRRFDRRFYHALSSDAERTQILSHHFADVKHQLSDSDLDLLGQATSGYTGADLVTLVISSAMAFVRTLGKATHFRKVTVSPDDSEDKTEGEMLVPCDSDAPGAIGITFKFLNPDRLLEVPVTRATVEEELKQTRSSVSEGDLQQMNQWHEEFGQGD
ncbi:hypothetical protein ACOMHN_034505 [Nucella lapillus]